MTGSDHVRYFRYSGSDAMGAFVNRAPRTLDVLFLPCRTHHSVPMTVFTLATSGRLFDVGVKI